jgi:excisionase family DNA binding protein
VEERVLLRPEEVAARLGIGRSVAYELIASGELESIKIGRSRRVPVRALDAFVEARRKEQAVAV